MKIAIGFFGITRSLKYTIKSIEKNILNVFRVNNIDYDIFLHTYNLSNYTNVRTQENVKFVDNEEYKLLKAKYVQIDVQDKIKQQINMLLYRTHKDPWGTNYNSVDNFILAQYSKSMLVNMIENTNCNYDYILYIRPDCLYIDTFSIDYFKYINNNTICIPNFHLFGKYKFNDRFCISNMKTYKLYGNVFRHLLEISKQQPLHSETILGELMHNYNLNIVKIPFRFSRVRFNGLIVDKFTPLHTQMSRSSYNHKVSSMLSGLYIFRPLK